MITLVGVVSRSRPRGAVIVIVLLVLTLLVVITGAIVKISSGSIQTVVGSEHREDAFRAAEAGAKLALLELKSDIDWNGFPEPVVKMPNGQSTYEVKVFTFDSPDKPANGVVVPDGLIYVQSTGRVPSGSSCQVGLMVKANGGVLDFAAVVEDNIALRNGSVVEARDPVTDLVLTSSATVVTNSTAPGAITLADNSRVEGMARPGVGASNSVVNIINTAEATLGYAPLESTIPLDPVVPPLSTDPSKDVLVNENGVHIDGVLQGGSAVLPPGAYGDLLISNMGTLEMEDGIYVFSNIHVDNSQIRILAGETVEMFATGSVRLEKSALVNESKTPATMKFHVVSGNVDLDLSGGGAAYYILNAPDSNVTLRNGSKQYGNLIAKNLEIIGSSLYYDPSIGGVASNSGTTMPIVKSYQRFDQK